MARTKRAGTMTGTVKIAMAAMVAVMMLAGSGWAQNAAREARTLVNSGHAHYTRGDLDQALADFNRAIELNPNLVDVYVMRGGVYLLKGNVERGFADLDRAVELDPNSAVAYFNRAAAYFMKNDFDRALADYTRAIELRPNFPEAYVGRAGAYNAKGNLERAIADFDRAIELNPNSADQFVNQELRQLSERYGEHAHYHTLRAKWERRQQVDEMIRTDPAFAEIIAFAKQLSSEIQYDWGALNEHVETYARQGIHLNISYTGAPPVHTPGMRVRECGGYSQEVFEKILNLNSVQSVEIWAGPGHVWNVLRLVDGRTLYFDLSAFDNERINPQTGVFEQLADYNWEWITFDENLIRSLLNSLPYGNSFYSKKRLIASAP